MEPRASEGVHLRRVHWLPCTVVVLLLVMMAEIFLSTRQVSASWDEGDHIFSGYMNWKHGEYDLNPEHPPLVKLIAALPLLPLQLKVPPRQGRYFKDEAYYGGRALLFHNGPHDGGRYTADSLLLRAHMAVSVFALTLALLLFFASREMFGPAAGLIAMTLFVFDPTILTNAPFVTTDSAAACLFFASVYVFYRYFKAPSWQRVLVCGLTFGLALVSKHSTILLLPILLLLAAVELAGRRIEQHRPMTHRELLRVAAALLAMAALALVVMWGFYSFRFAMHPVGENMHPLLPQLSSLSPPIAAVIHFFLMHHLLPQSYLYGLVDVQRVGNHMPSYIFGKLHAHGVWYYFPVALSLKWSAGVLGLLCLSLYAVARGAWRSWREICFLSLPALVYLAVAMAGPLNIGVRHVLPVFPFVFALAAGGAAWLMRQRRAWLFPIGLLLAWHVVDSVRMFPNYMPYANIFWGGPSKTHLYLSDSATDWGQELKWTRQYLDAHHIHNCWFAYFPAPFLLPADYGIPCKLLPTRDTHGQIDIDVPPVIDGPVLISYADLNGFEWGTKVRNQYQSFFERKPDAVIADGIAVYNGRFAVPALAATLPTWKAQDLLKAKNPAAASREADTALGFDPHDFDAEVAAGDALHQLGRNADALQQYRDAMALVDTMEPSSKAVWRADLNKRMAEL